MDLMETSLWFISPCPMPSLPYSSEKEGHYQGLYDHNFQLIYTILFSFPKGTWPCVRIQLAEEKPIVNINLHGAGQEGF